MDKESSMKRFYLSLFAAAAFTSTNTDFFSNAFPISILTRKHIVDKFSHFAQRRSIVCLNTSNDKGSDAMVYDTIMRYELKKEIIECAESFKSMQEEMFKLKDVEADAKKRARKTRRKRDILKRIFLLQKKSGTSKDLEDETLEAQRTKMKGLFGSSSFGTATVTLGDKGEEIIAVAERLAEFNPTQVPTYGWQGYKGGDPKIDCLLDGNWKLRFTTGADATFRESQQRGKAITSQEIDAVNGTLTNVIGFEKGTIENFRVIVEGAAESDTDIALSFKKIVIKRRKKLFALFETVTIPLPSFRVLRAFAKIASMGRANAKKAGFQLKYIDQDFRMHKTNDGNWFIQTRLKKTTHD